ncbi:MAG TPA: hypothetical protein VKZ54_10675 [Membranihabitans sp.]|nr:hypothetical protein [Membranihabitans sp.]
MVFSWHDNSTSSTRPNPIYDEALQLARCARPGMDMDRSPHSYTTLIYLVNQRKRIKLSREIPVTLPSIGS